MKNTIKLFWFIALIAVLALSMAACKGKSKSGDTKGLQDAIAKGDWSAISENVGGIVDGQTNGKKITITGLNGITGTALFEVNMYTKNEYGNLDEDTVAMDIWGRTIKDNSVTFSPLDIKRPPLGWTGSGSHNLILQVNHSDNRYERYFYTDGKTWAQLGIKGWDDLSKLPKYNIRSNTSTIPFNKFILSIFD
jgi:hypothetical protein